MPELLPDLSAFSTLLQPDTLILLGVALLWQQSRFQGKRLDEFKESQDKRLDEFREELKDLRAEVKEELKDLRAEIRAVNARLDRVDAKMDRVLELLAARSSTVKS